jgi:hypothetical protein
MFPYFRCSTEKFPYDLIEEKRFPGMQNTTLRNAIAADIYLQNLPNGSNDANIIRE